MTTPGFVAFTFLLRRCQSRAARCALTDLCSPKRAARVVSPAKSSTRTYLKIEFSRRPMVANSAQAQNGADREHLGIFSFGKRPPIRVCHEA